MVKRQFAKQTSPAGKTLPMSFNNHEINQFFESNREKFDSEQFVLFYIRVHKMFIETFGESTDIATITQKLCDIQETICGRIDASIPECIDESLDGNQVIQEIRNQMVVIYDNMNKLFSKTASKGKEAEKVYTKLLQKHFDVEECSATPHSTDFVLNNKILFELKNYSSSVPTTQVEKFINDIDARGLPGIMAAVDSRISKKKDFSFEVSPKGNVLFYIHNLHTDMEKLVMAATIVERLQEEINKCDAPAPTFEVTEEQFRKIQNDITTMYSEMAKIEKHQEQALLLLRKLQMKKLIDYMNQI